MRVRKASAGCNALIVALSIAACGEGRSSPPTVPTPFASTDTVLGRYSLRVSAGPSCTSLPEVARTRTYTATITSRSTSNYLITLSDATFMRDESLGNGRYIIRCSAASGLDCNQFVAERDGQRLAFHLIPNYIRLDDEFAGVGGSIAEIVPPDNNTLEISGRGFGQQDGTAIHASISGDIWYCPDRYLTTDECASCRNATVGMTFTRR